MTFFLIFFSIYSFLHYYIYRRITIDFSLAEYRVLVGFVLFACSLPFVLTRMLSNHYSFSGMKLLGNYWFAIISIGTTVFFIKDVISFFKPNHDQNLSILSLFCILILLISGVHEAKRPPRVKTIDIPLENLSGSLDGFSIVQLSDLHIDNLKSVEWLKSIVETTNSLKPDLIVITGDILDMNFDDFEAFGKTLNEFQSVHGVFAVTGNHDFYMGIDNFTRLMEKARIRVLRNSSVVIAEEIQLAGIDDNTGIRFESSGGDIVKATKGCDRGKPLVLLSHKPMYYETAEASAVDLMLCGHTHAGQFLPYNLFVDLMFRFPHGFGKFKSMYLYSSSGTGTWGPAVRLFSKSEIVCFKLKRLK